MENIPYMESGKCGHFFSLVPPNLWKAWSVYRLSPNFNIFVLEVSAIPQIAAGGWHWIFCRFWRGLWREEICNERKLNLPRHAACLTKLYLKDIFCFFVVGKWRKINGLKSREKNFALRTKLSVLNIYICTKTCWNSTLLWLTNG